MDEVRVWSKALSASDAAELFTQASPPVAGTMAGTSPQSLDICVLTTLDRV